MIFYFRLFRICRRKRTNQKKNNLVGIQRKK
nr:MAG TPA: hypothetical protein [Caudoviricetes sp.]DAX98077.1 MAG TPA: hypothetical protein [Caudoviricetes sp.]